jgi:hypothetical protein
LALNNEQQNKAMAHLNSKWVGKRECSVCKNNSWNIHPQVYEMRQFNEGGMVLGGPLLPLIIVECNNCGNTISINAIKAGVVSSERKGETSNDKK